MIQNLNEMTYLINYIYNHNYNPWFFLTPDYGFFVLDNGYNLFIHRETKELATVNVYDMFGNAAYDELYGICEDNHIPCKSEGEIINIIDAIRNLNRKDFIVH